MEALISSRELADSVAAWDRDWLESETWRAPVVIWSTALETWFRMSFNDARVAFRFSLITAWSPL